MLDPRYQYALHTTSFDEQPMSDKTLSRFRKRCYDYDNIPLDDSSRIWSKVIDTLHC